MDSNLFLKLLIISFFFQNINDFDKHYVFYKINCFDCNAYYVEQTKSHINLESSAQKNSVCFHGHNSDWINTKIVDEQKNIFHN